MKRLAVALLLAATAARAERFALFVGEPSGGPGTRPLHYADRDARRMYQILTQLGGVNEADARLLIGAPAADVRRALEELSVRAQAARDAGRSTSLLVFYSGHAKDGALRLGESQLPLSELRSLLEHAPADVRIGLFDSCQSGAITRSKGVRPAPAFDVQRAREAASGPRGLVLIASSAADEESQESDEINGGFFTHALATGLLGDADENRDGRVTLAEAYAYAYQRTVGSTAGTAAGAQHPVYLYDLGGAGDVVLTEPGGARGSLVLGAALEGVYVVLDSGRRAVAEVAKAPGEVRRLALAPGRYTVKKRDGDSLLVGDLRVGDGPVDLSESQLARRSLDDDPQRKGATPGPRWSLLGSVGAQRFFDQRARESLFPTTALVGVELAARGDLGHSLSYGFDLGLGGGKATLKVQGLDPLPASFSVFAAGASLWRDFDAGAWTFSAGVRVAYQAHFRTFDGRPDLPKQVFSTLTPGLVAGAQWHLGSGFSALVRGRLNYLLYNVDTNRSLGFGELSFGVEYAFGD